MKNSNLVTVGAVAAGIGIGSFNPPPESVETIVQVPVEVVKEVTKEVRFEALTDRADKSIRDALGVDTNADVVALVEKLKANADRDKDLKLQAAAQIKSMQQSLIEADKAISARQQYESYQSDNLEGWR